jgi:hypothetical protein
MNLCARIFSTFLAKTTNNGVLFANILDEQSFPKGTKEFEQSLIVDTKIFVLESLIVTDKHPRSLRVIERDTATEKN